MIETMEIERALSDLAEVRERLAEVQRFEGYSGPAAFASGIVAVAAGAVQAFIDPFPTTADAIERYLAYWLVCLAIALILNYGAVALWLLRHRDPGARSRFRTAALSIAPSVLLGGALTLGLVDHRLFTLLPGTWFAFYALGLFASRGAIPAPALIVAVGFAIFALLFLATPLQALALSWWVMPAAFGIGQAAIGVLLWKERAA